MALSIISLCALIVSIYQARVLSSQQRAMEAQQEIMIQNAKAQLWPNLQVFLNVNGREDGGVELDLGIANTGTGPAIVEGFQLQFRDKYLSTYRELWDALAAPDSIQRNYGTTSIGNRTIQAGESFSFLRFNTNYSLAQLLYDRINNGESPTFYVCYRSVFKDYYRLEATYDSNSFDVAEPAENCTLTGDGFDSRSY
ncbi:hypothetical protein [Neolewinella sp.]|uniref:hypothetical protein n=1 Tax=Neolewinella sp. TaxID=2993543 RepID=UPI003B51FB52